MTLANHGKVKHRSEGIRIARMHGGFPVRQHPRPTRPEGIVFPHQRLKTIVPTETALPSIHLHHTQPTFLSPPAESQPPMNIRVTPSKPESVMRTMTACLTVFISASFVSANDVPAPITEHGFKKQAVPMFEMYCADCHPVSYTHLTLPTKA